MEDRDRRRRAGAGSSKRLWSLRLVCLLTWAALLVVSASPGIAADWIYTLRQGENPWTLAERHLRTVALVDRLVALNRIADPHAMAPGSKLRIPLTWLKSRPATAEIVAKSGEVFRLDDGVEQPVELTQHLGLGDGLRTAIDSSATVRFADASRFIIGPRSLVWFDEVRSLGDGTMVDTRVRLAEGEIRSERDGSGPIGGQEIRTRQGVAAVRGTIYRVRTGEDATTSEVLRGRVTLRGDRAGSRSVDISAGRGSVVPTGGDPLPPRALLPPPSLQQGAERLDRVPIQIAVEPVAGAVAYRLEIADDPGFTRIRASRSTAGPTIVGPDLPDGQYSIRLRAIDVDGIEGRDRETLVTLDARPEPPSLLEPKRQGKVREPKPTFRWAALENAKAYRLQVASDENFASLAIAEEITAATLTAAPDLPEGHYWWRVATRDTDDEVGPFGDVETFERKDPPPAPTGSEIDSAEGPPTLRWRAALPGASYRVQMASDKSFDGPVLDRTVEEPSLELRGLTPGTYFLRIATLLEGEDPGPFGPAQRIEVPPAKWWPALLLPWALALLVLL